MKNQFNCKVSLIVAATVMFCSLTHGAGYGGLGSNIDQGQWSAGIDYFNTQIDVDIEGYDVTTDNEIDAVYSRIGYGLFDNTEIYVRLGAAYLETIFDNDRSYGVFNSDGDFSYGWGIAANLYEQEKITWGLSFQMTWFNFEDKITDSWGDQYDEEIDLCNIQLGFGPTIELNDSWRLYGGVDINNFSGNYKSTHSASGSTWDAEFEEKYKVGGLIGSQFDLSDNASLYVEYAFNEDGHVLGTGVNWKF